MPAERLSSDKRESVMSLSTFAEHSLFNFHPRKTFSVESAESADSLLHGIELAPSYHVASNAGLFESN